LGPAGEGRHGALDPRYRVLGIAGAGQSLGQARLPEALVLSCAVDHAVGVEHELVAGLQVNTSRVPLLLLVEPEKRCEPPHLPWPAGVDVIGGRVPGEHDVRRCGLTVLPQQDTAQAHH
jgi:hypothetical protein